MKLTLQPSTLSRGEVLDKLYAAFQRYAELVPAGSAAQVNWYLKSRSKKKEDMEQLKADRLTYDKFKAALEELRMWKVILYAQLGSTPDSDKDDA